MNLSHIDTALYDFVNRAPVDLGYYHPYIVDFAIVIPITALFFHFVSILTNNAEYLKASNLLFFAGVIAIMFAYFTGRANGNEVREVLSLEGRGLYDAHLQIGSMIFGGFVLLVILKIISLIVKKDVIRYILGSLFFMIILVILYQNSLGNALVFDFGAGVATAPY